MTSQRARDAAVTAASRALTLVTVVAAIGTLPWITGTDPAYTVLRARAGDQIATADALARVRADLGLADDPFEHLLGWSAAALQGELGTSWVSGEPVAGAVVRALGVSLTLMAFALLVAVAVAVPVVTSAFRGALRGTPRRSTGRAAAAVTALPEFLLATSLVVLTVALAEAGLDSLPPYGWAGPMHAVLPALALGVPAGGYLGGLAADAVTSCGRETWIATWTTAGFSRPRIALALAHRTLPVLLPQVGLIVVGMTAGAVAVEQVFAVPGLGRTTLAAAQAQDLPVVGAGVLLLLALGSVVGLLTGLAAVLVLGRTLRTATLTLAQARGSGRAGALVAGGAATVLGAAVLIGLFGDPYSSRHARLAPPSADLLLGADASGRDLLARIAHGAAATIWTSLLVTAGCLVVGVLAGLAPRLLTGPIEVANALPPVVVGIVVAAVTGPTATGAAIAVLVVGWAPLAVHTAALVAQARAQPFVQMLPLLGTGSARTLLRHVLPTVLPTVARHAVLRLPGTALALAGLAFLGLGEQPPAPTWGLVLAEGMPYVERAPWVVLAPAVSLVALSVLAVAAASVGSWRPRPDRYETAPR